MGYATVHSIALVGLAGQPVVVEADVTNGLPGVVLSGLPDTALQEARDRVRAAIVNSGQDWPQRRITVNLLPANVPKQGSGFDVAIAIVLLAGAGVLPLGPLDGVVLLGELGLDGRLRAVRGVLPAVLAALRAGLRRVVVPTANAAEAALVPGVTIRSADTLRRLIDFIRGAAPLLEPPQPSQQPSGGSLDLADVVGQERGRRVIELAAAGAHHLALYGPPGAGKTMLATRLPTILPPLDDRAALETTAVYSIAGALPPTAQLIRHPPFQAPHHTASVAALVGGGSGLARPGAVSLAHHGVLFLDEAPEFAPSVLDALRQPLEDGHVRLLRIKGETVYPAKIQLVLAANPCPCANYGVAACDCPPSVRRRYLGRLSGPLLDRIDLHVNLEPVRAAALLGEPARLEDSATVAARVADARDVAAARWSAHGWPSNAAVPGAVLRQPPFRLPRTATTGLVRGLDTGAISARGFDRILRIAWTITDLDGRDRPVAGDVAEAMQLRMGARW
jgi:magnesium chelatase family protein